MNEKLTIFIIILLILGGGIFAYTYFQKLSDKKFLSQLKGEIVFARRDKGVLNIYKINANGTGLMLIYHNEDNNSAYLPEWSEDGEKIYFATLKKGEAKPQTYVLTLKTEEIKKAEGLSERKRTREELSRAEDLMVKNGNVFWKDMNGKFHQVYRFFFYNYKLNPGASEASWSPDREYIIFQTCGFLRGCRIMIADKQGRVTQLTKGEQPDWKY